MEKRFHSPRNLAEAIAVEAGELLECFLWDRHDPNSQATDPWGPTTGGVVEGELADVLIYALNMANSLGVDAADVVLAKLSLNTSRFPLDVRVDTPPE